VVAVDPEEAVAWKNGLFQFNNVELALVMRQIERWYDVTVVYQAGVPAQHFTGLISRNTSLSQVLNMLEVTGGLHFKVEERKVIVLAAGGRSKE
jgi:transmembrane sensor